MAIEKDKKWCRVTPKSHVVAGDAGLKVAMSPRKVAMPPKRLPTRLSQTRNSRNEPISTATSSRWDAKL